MDEFFHCDKCDGKKVPNDCNNSDQLDMFAVLIDHFPMVIFKYIYIYINHHYHDWGHIFK